MAQVQVLYKSDIVSTTLSLCSSWVEHTVEMWEGHVSPVPLKLTPTNPTEVVSNTKYQPKDRTINEDPATQIVYSHWHACHTHSARR